MRSPTTVHKSSSQGFQAGYDRLQALRVDTFGSVHGDPGFASYQATDGLIVSVTNNCRPGTIEYGYFVS